MSQRAIAASTPTTLLQRVVTWWLAQVKHALPPTIFFFVGFNLILWTKRLILQEQGVEFSGFLTATLAALLVGKAVLVTDNLPFMHRFDGAPMIQPILFKSAIYWICVDRAAGRGTYPFRCCRRRNRRFRRPLRRSISVGALFVNSDMADGPVSRLRHDTRA